MSEQTFGIVVTILAIVTLAVVIAIHRRKDGDGDG